MATTTRVKGRLHSARSVDPRCTTSGVTFGRLRAMPVRARPDPGCLLSARLRATFLSGGRAAAGRPVGTRMLAPDFRRFGWKGLRGAAVLETRRAARSGLRKGCFSPAAERPWTGAGAASENGEAEAGAGAVAGTGAGAEEEGGGDEGVGRGAGRRARSVVRLGWSMRAISSRLPRLTCVVGVCTQRHIPEGVSRASDFGVAFHLRGSIYSLWAGRCAFGTMSSRRDASERSTAWRWAGPPSRQAWALGIPRRATVACGPRSF